MANELKERRVLGVVQNALDQATLDVSAREMFLSAADPSRLVTICSRAGSLYLQHDMTPGQARLLAKMLLDAAEYLDGVRV